MFESSAWLIAVIAAPFLLTSIVAYAIYQDERASFARRSPVRRAAARLLVLRR